MALGFHRLVIYQWLAKIRSGGMSALKEKPAPGRPTRLLRARLRCLYELVVGTNPLQPHFAYGLWTRAMIQELIWRGWQVRPQRECGGAVAPAHGPEPAESALYRTNQQNPKAGQRWREVEFPAIQKLARQEGAEIFFCDESGIPSDYHGGTAWAAVSRRSVPGVRLRFMVVEGAMNGERFIQFLKRLTHNAGGPSSWWWTDIPPVERH